MERLTEYLNKYGLLSEDIKVYLHRHGKLKSYSKGEYFVTQYDIQHSWCFLLEGLAGYQTLDNKGNLKLERLCPVNHYFLGTKHIFSKSTNRTAIQFLQPSAVYIISNVPHPISGELFKHEVAVDQSGKFPFEFDVETETSYIGIYSSINPYKTLRVKSINGTTTDINITYNSNLDIKAIHVTPATNQHDMGRYMEDMRKMIDYRSKEIYPSLYNLSIDDYLKYAKNVLSERLHEVVNNDSLLSEEFKGILVKDFGLFLYNILVFEYENKMKRNYLSTTNDTGNTPIIQNFNRSYFRFLKDFNLNNPQYLNNFSFPEFQLEMLHSNVLNLSKIGESDIPTWLTNVKSILAELVGFDEGPYYDILVANAYARQLNEEITPLTEKQKEHITNYWQNGEIAKILFRKNQQVVGLNKVKSPVVINDISNVPKDKVMDAILSKYKEKVVLIDLWATWCGPCLNAIKQFSSTKGDFQDKDVVFVYLTNESSPKKLWEEKIKGIGSEHYYLTKDQWYYVMDHFGFDAIPSYLLYNKESILLNKFTGSPGNDAIKEMINEALK